MNAHNLWLENKGSVSKTSRGTRMSTSTSYIGQRIQKKESTMKEMGIANMKGKKTHCSTCLRQGLLRIRINQPARVHGISWRNLIRCNQPCKLISKQLHLHVTNENASINVMSEF